VERRGFQETTHGGIIQGGCTWNSTALKHITAEVQHRVPTYGNIGQLVLRLNKRYKQTLLGVQQTLSKTCRFGTSVAIMAHPGTVGNGMRRIRIPQESGIAPSRTRYPSIEEEVLV
jgi:hypothetical protein